MPPPRQIQKVAFSSCTRIDSGCVLDINQFENRTGLLPTSHMSGWSQQGSSQLSNSYDLDHYPSMSWRYLPASSMS